MQELYWYPKAIAHLTQTYAQLNYVFLLEGVGSEWRAIALGGNQDANTVYSFMSFA